MVTTPLDSPAEHWLDVVVRACLHERTDRAETAHRLMVASAVAEGLGERWTA